MVDKWYEDLTPEEKAKTLLLGDDVYAFFHSDPETCVDTQGCMSPVTLRQGFEIVNDELIPLWFKVEAAVTSGDPTKWSDLTKEFGSVAANGRTLFFWTPKREIPSSLTHEAMTLTIRAYKDSGYTQLYGEDTVTWEFYFFDHSWPSAVIIDEDDFEGTLEGWSSAGYNRFEYKTGYAYKGAYSLNIAGYRTSGGAWRSGILDASGQWVPNKAQNIRKSIAIGAYSQAFVVVHMTRSGQNPNNCVRVHYNDKDHIIRTNIPAGPFQPWRCCAKLWVDATKTLRISVVTGADGSYGWDDVRIDDIIIVAFPGCPPAGEEQLTNSGFETGDFTGWDHDEYDYAQIGSAYPRSGGYACELRGSGWIAQDLENPVPAECLTDSSVLGFYAGNDTVYYFSLTFYFRATLIYDDESTTVVDFEWNTIPDQQTPYEYVDLKPYVEAGKTLVAIKIERLASQEDVWIDDVSCYV